MEVTLPPTCKTSTSSVHDKTTFCISLVITYTQDFIPYLLLSDTISCISIAPPHILLYFLIAGYHVFQRVCAPFVPKRHVLAPRFEIVINYHISGHHFASRCFDGLHCLVCWPFVVLLGTPDISSSFGVPDGFVEIYMASIYSFHPAVNSLSRRAPLFITDLHHNWRRHVCGSWFDICNMETINWN